MICQLFLLLVVGPELNDFECYILLARTVLLISPAVEIQMVSKKMKCCCESLLRLSLLSILIFSLPPLDAITPVVDAPVIEILDGKCTTQGDCCNCANQFCASDARCGCDVDVAPLNQDGPKIFDLENYLAARNRTRTRANSRHRSYNKGNEVTTQSEQEGTMFPTGSLGTTTPTYAPTVASVPTQLPTAVSSQEDTASSCHYHFCTMEVSNDCKLAYKINNGLTITMELTCEGSGEWIGIGFSNDGKMQGSEAVLGVPGEQPLKYALNGKYAAAVIPMPEHKQTLTDASLEVDEDRRTIMRFTKVMKEEDEIEIRSGENIFLFARGMTSTLGYHPQRSSFKLTL